MSLEISEGGMSIALSEGPGIGETIEIEPVVVGKVSAVVRHRQGTICGLQFLRLTEDETRLIREFCAKLPPFNPRSLNI